MKKIAFVILSLFFSLNLFAQERSMPYGFRLGLTAHPNFGFGKAENGKGDGVALGFSYGLIGDFNFAENYSFSTAITVTTMNAKVTQVVNSTLSSFYPPPQIEQKSKYKMQYIEVPLTIKLKTDNINGIRWYGQFGIANDIRIGAKFDVESSEFSIKDMSASNFTKLYRAGVVIGGGGEFQLNGKTSLLLGITLNNGFTNISERGDGSVKNHNVGINLGVFF